MKLYATTEGVKLGNDGKYTTVKKGQGSNTQINIKIHIDDEVNPAYMVFINKREDQSTDICITDTSIPFPKNEIYKSKK